MARQIITDILYYIFSDRNIYGSVKRSLDVWHIEKKLFNTSEKFAVTKNNKFEFASHYKHVVSKKIDKLQKLNLLLSIINDVAKEQGVRIAVEKAMHSECTYIKIKEK